MNTYNQYHYVSIIGRNKIVHKYPKDLCIYHVPLEASNALVAINSLKQLISVVNTYHLCNPKVNLHYCLHYRKQ